MLLGAAVGVDGAEREVLGDRHLLGRAVDRGRGGEDERAHVRALHGLQQHERAGDVVGVVAQRQLDRLADRLEPGEVDDGVDAAAVERRPEDLVQGGRVLQVDLLERRLAAGQLGYPGQALRAGVGQVVDDDDLVTGLEEQDDGVAADVAGAARHEDPHEVRRYLLRRAVARLRPGRSPRSPARLLDQPRAGRLDLGQAPLEVRRPAVPGVVDLQGASGHGRVVVLAEQPDLGSALLVGRPAPQDVQVSPVGDQDQVALGEPGPVELPCPVLRSVVPVVRRGPAPSAGRRPRPRASRRCRRCRRSPRRPARRRPASSGR